MRRPQIEPTIPLTFSGNEQTPYVRRVGVEGDGIDPRSPVGRAGIGVHEGTQNLCTNGGFETNTTGWAAGGTNTIATSTEQAKFGSRSLKCTYQDDVVLAGFNITLTAAAHAYSVWIYIPSSYDGTEIDVRLVNFTSMTGTTSVDANMSLRDQWQRVEVPNVTPDAGDLSGIIRVIEAGSAPTAGRFIYIDGVQVEAQPIATPYVETDGGTASRSNASMVLQRVDEYLSPVEGAASFLFETGWPDDYQTVILWEWGDDSNNRLSLFIGGGTFNFRRSATAGSAIVNASTGTFSKGALKCLTIDWSPTTIGLSVDGGARATAASTNIPTLTSRDLYLLRRAYGAALWGNANALSFVGMRRPVDAFQHGSLNQILRRIYQDPELVHEEAFPGNCTLVWPGHSEWAYDGRLLRSAA